MLNLDLNRKLRKWGFPPRKSGTQESYQEIQESKIFTRKSKNRDSYQKIQESRFPGRKFKIFQEVKRWYAPIETHVKSGIANKTAGYHRHIFSWIILLKMLFKKMEAFFFKKLIKKIQIWKISDFWKKISQLRLKKSFSRWNITWYPFYSKFVTISDFGEYQVSQKKPNFFQKTFVFEKSY